MTDLLNNVDLLDPTRELRDVDAALGGGVFDKWSDLDPALAATRINSKKPGTLGLIEYLDDYRRLQALNAAVAGGGGDYVAKAVHFSGGAHLSIASLVGVTDVDVFSTVGWMKYPDNMTNTAYFWVIDPLNNFNGWAIIQKAGNPNENFNTFVNSNIDPFPALGVSGDPGLDLETYPVPGSWYCFISTMSTNFPAGQKKYKVYVGDVDATGSVSDTGDAFAISLLGLPFYIGNDTFSNTAAFDMADLRVLPGVSLLDGNGGIPLATRRLFIDGSGKPVDPAVATAALGTAGAALFSGDADTFPTNQGTGGAFTLTGSLTNATTSPSD